MNVIKKPSKYLMQCPTNRDILCSELLCWVYSNLSWRGTMCVRCTFCGAPCFAQQCCWECEVLCVKWRPTETISIWSTSRYDYFRPTRRKCSQEKGTLGVYYGLVLGLRKEKIRETNGSRDMFLGPRNVFCGANSSSKPSKCIFLCS